MPYPNMVEREVSDGIIARLNSLTTELRSLGNGDGGKRITNNEYRIVNIEY